MAQLLYRIELNSTGVPNKMARDYMTSCENVSGINKTLLL